ncbi:putative gas vesicle structural protein 2 [Streptomyces anthocyanicus]|uniref:Gas vesicle protein A2 n=7 Tax=Streptomyces TaxID=1883 RepID=GVPA2_STRCO|nr:MULTISPECIES: gas vesicle structural protein GvpA [Streptomyces]Q9RJB4.1 RecName: Full=Gas vesicle protein A2; Short=GvpA2 [Streptomyces coelicolor A3(2)]QSJ13432.1 gas vesicle synthesis-like protein [Streptomyces lividans]AIJ17819.1 gas vesicle synthesis-like protein [Streptomyces lividans TK24]EOY45340.1 putative gas vesicle synthesis protein [Streptomyces lividans 1326]KKD12041.1 gas vesicle protein [Streptomyces sp. WM6391]MBQ0947161.1 gas vesicle structural protein GvpA [Streptomyces 
MITYDDEVVCAPRAGTLYDVLELILDRGMVIDVFVRVSLVGIEILKVDARIVVASVDTYLRFAEACNRLDLEHDVRSKTVPEMFGSPMAKTVGRAGARRTARSLTDKVRDVLTPEHEHEEEPEEAEDRPRAGAERGRSTQRPRSRPAARPRDEDDRPRSRPRRRTEEEDR